MTPSILDLEVALARHQQRLQEAERERLYRQFRRSRPGLRQRLGDFLIAAGRRLTVKPRSNAAPFPRRV